jgi:hypothetical protein
MQGEDKVYECTFVQTDVVEGCKYFATKCRLGPNGVAEVLALPDLSPFETEKLATVKKELNKNIETGEQFAASFLQQNAGKQERTAGRDSRNSESRNFPATFLEQNA